MKKKSWCNDQFSISTEFNFKSHDMQLGRFLLKFVYSEKAKVFCEISTVDLTITTSNRSKVEISQDFVAFSEYMNFTHHLSYFELNDRKSVIIR